MKVQVSTRKIISFSLAIQLVLLISNVSASPKVEINLYYEALCPFSADYIANQLYPTYEKFGKYIDLDYVPYGNAEMVYHPSNASYTFTCQHGEEECMANKIHGCLHHGFNDTDYDAMLQQLHIVNCMMMNSNFGRLFYCLKEVFPDLTKIGPIYKNLLDCASGKDGIQVMAEMGNVTAELVPPQEYVPWVTVDGKHEEGAEKNLSNFLCENILMNVPECEENVK